MRARRVGWLAAGAILALPAAASADEQIQAAPPNRYVSTEVTMDQGEPLFFSNSDIAMHDVTHTAETPLFRSELVGQGESSFVEGSQYLITGTYAFHCSVHPEMKGTLNVTDRGVPQPRPGADDPPDTQEPAVALELRRYSARRVKRTRRVRLLVGADEAARLTVRVSVGRRRAGRLGLRLASAGTRRVDVRLSRRVRQRIRRGRRLTVLVRARDAAGNVGTDQRSTRLR